jgi:hypothetical protein
MTTILGASKGVTFFNLIEIELLILSRAFSDTKGNSSTWSPSNSLSSLSYRLFLSIKRSVSSSVYLVL